MTTRTDKITITIAMTIAAIMEPDSLDIPIVGPLCPPAKKISFQFENLFKKINIKLFSRTIIRENTNLNQAFYHLNIQNDILP